ncbi:MAG: hypothetical protein ACHP8A_00340 [Terriglobales bacterium]|jgi:hypothetical protein|nr:hypothetical protein [Terriglobales bacterium]
MVLGDASLHHTGAASERTQEAGPPQPKEHFLTYFSNGFEHFAGMLIPQ